LAGWEKSGGKLFIQDELKKELDRWPNG
jgi:hypothetical protein